MSLSDLAALGSLASGLGVLLSLLFLFFQLRQISAQMEQAKKYQRAIMNQGALAGTAEAIRAYGEPNAAKLMSRVVAGEQDFSAPELYQLGMILRQGLINTQDLMFQHREGLIQDETLDNAFRANRSILAQPVFRAIWMQARDTYVPELASRVDKLISERPPSRPSDAVARFRTTLAGVIASENQDKNQTKSD